MAISFRDSLWECTYELCPWVEVARPLGTYDILCAIKDAALVLFLNGEVDSHRAWLLRMALREFHLYGMLPAKVPTRCPARISATEARLCQLHKGHSGWHADIKGEPFETQS